MSSHILSANVWCAQDDKAERMGIESGDIWMPITIRWDEVITIKEAGDNEFIGKGRATIYVRDTHFVIDKDYYDALKEWEIYLEDKHKIHLK